MLRSNLFAVIVLLLPNLAHAAVITYTDRSVFDAAIISNSYVSQTLDFESETGLIPSTTSVAGITFSYNFGGTELFVSNLYYTTSGTKFLGTNDVGNLLLDGDDFSLSFSARTAIGLYVISIDPLVDGDFTLTAGGSTASLITTAIQQTLLDGSKVYFLGLIDNSSTFTSAILETHGGGAFTYNVDDIITASSAAVPEPASGLLIASITSVLFTLKKWRRSRGISEIDATN